MQGQMLNYLNNSIRTFLNLTCSAKIKDVKQTVAFFNTVSSHLNDRVFGSYQDKSAKTFRLNMLQPRTQASIYAPDALPLRTCCKIWTTCKTNLKFLIMIFRRRHQDILLPWRYKQNFHWRFKQRLTLTDRLKPISTKRIYLYEAKR